MMLRSWSRMRMAFMLASFPRSLNSACTARSQPSRTARIAQAAIGWSDRPTAADLRSRTPTYTCAAPAPCVGHKQASDQQDRERAIEEREDPGRRAVAGRPIEIDDRRKLAIAEPHGLPVRRHSRSGGHGRWRRARSSGRRGSTCAAVRRGFWRRRSADCRPCRRRLSPGR